MGIDKKELETIVGPKEAERLWNQNKPKHDVTTIAGRIDKKIEDESIDNKKKRKAKFGNKKTVVNGIEFDSKKEANRYVDLNLMQKAGEISGLILQPEFQIITTFEYRGQTIRGAKYIADFEYVDKATGETIVEDTKGVKTKDYILKKKLFLLKYGDKYLFREL